MSKVTKFTQRFFWFAFASFLAASIAHVAFFFRAFEPQADGRDMLWWCVSFSIALSIDVTIFLLSVTVANLHRRRSARSLISSVWLFIIGLAVLSFYINYKYAQHFTDMGMISPTALSIPWVGTIGDINPFIASCFQILAIAYTWIADKIVSDEKPKTAEQLKIEADELENLLTQKKRITAIKRDAVQETGGLIGSIGEKIQRVKREYTSIINDGNVQESDKQSERNTALTSEESTEESDKQFTDNTEESSRVQDKKAQGNDEESIGAFTEENIPSWLSSSGSTVSLQTVVQHTQLSLKKLRNRVESKQIRSTRNKDIVYKDSLIAWMKQEGIIQETAKIVHLKPVRNEEDSRADTEGITLSMIEQRMYEAITSNPQETTELLRLSREHSLEDFTAMLKQRYSQYAGYITPTRVVNVLAYAKQHTVKPTLNGHHNEGITDDMEVLSVGDNTR